MVWNGVCIHANNFHLFTLKIILMKSLMCKYAENQAVNDYMTFLPVFFKIMLYTLDQNW